MPKSEFNWKITGYAGQGILTTGLLLAKTCTRLGLSVFDYMEYPSLIRGGHNTIQLKAATRKVYAQERLLDVLIALNSQGVSLHLDELTPTTVIIYDEADGKFNPLQWNAKGTFANVPLVELARQVGAERVMANNVALGVSMFLLGLPLDTLNEVATTVFGRKNETIVKLNQDAATAGFRFAQQKLKPLSDISFQEKRVDNQIVLTGNEAAGLGAISAGCKYYSAYPMTPSSALLHYMASKAEEYNLVVKHAEDEISAINQAVGASYAGVRAMTGTSGGGFALMVEGLSLAGMSETPLVIYEGQRPGPATGLPTWTSQGDLQFVLRAGHGEFPRAVLTPGDVEETFHLTRLAFEIAEAFHTQVFILTDKYLAESHENCQSFAKTFTNTRFGFVKESDKGPGFRRYKETPSGVSDRALPGDPQALFLGNSYEHDEYGLVTEESQMTSLQVAKRLRKHEGIVARTPQPLKFGPQDAQMTFVSWGSNKGPILSGLEKLQEKGITGSFIHFPAVWPFPRETATSLLRAAKRPILVECNATAQLGQLIRQETGIVIEEKLLKYDGRPFYPEEIVAYASRS